MTPNDRERAELDKLFEAAKTPQPPDHLMARVLADALTAQPLPIVRIKPNWRRQITALLGGWQGMGGLVAATCAGLWIGIFPPANLPVGLDAFLGEERYDVEEVLAQQDPSISGFGWDLDEG